MRKVILNVLFLIVLLGLIGTVVTKDRPHHPISISNGLTFEIPRKYNDRFYLTGLYPHKKHNLKDFLTNSVAHKNIESTQVLFDGELISDSSIMYTTTSSAQPDKITVHLRGNLDPKKIRGYLRRM